MGPRVALAIAIFLAAALAGCADRSGVLPEEPDEDEPVEAVEVAINDCENVPTYAVDSAWPPTLPAGSVFGEIAGLAVDSEDNVWVLHRPGLSTSSASGFGTGLPVMQFSGAGELLRQWGGPGPGFDWPTTEHGLGIDGHGSIWIGGNAASGDPGGASGADNMLLKFDENGSFLLQIGGRGTNQGSHDTANVGRVADIVADDAHVFVADGYGNKRVVVFSLAGDYVRHWGAYGNEPDDDVDDPTQQFGRPVHGIAMATDDTLFVADRENGRIQSFTTNGTFVAEYSPPTDTLESRPVVFDVALTGYDDQLLVVADGWLPFRGSTEALSGGSDRIIVTCRATGEVLTQLHGGPLPVAGPGLPGQPGQFTTLHAIAVDSTGAIYASDLRHNGHGGSIQKFVRTS